MKRTLFKAAFALLTGVALALGLGAAYSASKTPFDESLSPNEYEKLGLPPVAEDWGAAQRTRARSVLRELVTVHPERLPRFESAVSGAVFQKLLDEEVHRRGEIEGALGSLTGNQMKKMDDQDFAELIQGDSLEWIYSPDTTGGLVYDREIVQIASGRLVALIANRFELDSTRRKLEEEPLPGRDFATDYRELIELNDYSTVRLAAGIAGFAISEDFSRVARDEAAEALWLSVPAFEPHLPGEMQTALRAAITEAAGSPAASPTLGELAEAW